MRMAYDMPYAESFCVSNIPPGQPGDLSITVSVFLSTSQIIALLLKKIRLLLYCYTLVRSMRV